MKQSKKLESLKSTIFQDSNKILGGAGSRPTPTGELRDTLGTNGKVVDQHRAPEGPKSFSTAI